MFKLKKLLSGRQHGAATAVLAGLFALGLSVTVGAFAWNGAVGNAASVGTATFTVSAPGGSTPLGNSVSVAINLSAFAPGTSANWGGYDLELNYGYDANTPANSVALVTADVIGGTNPCGAFWANTATVPEVVSGCAFQASTFTGTLETITFQCQNNGVANLHMVPLGDANQLFSGTKLFDGNAVPFDMTLQDGSITCGTGGASPTPTDTVVAPTDTPTNTPVAPTDTPTNTPVVPTDTPTNTPVGPTDTPTNTPVAPTDTPTNTPVAPTDTPTNTPVAPTDTPTNTPVGPTDTPTNTPVAPTDTPTNTPVGPTDTPTNTPVAPTDTPTNTPVPATATATPTPSACLTVSQRVHLILGVVHRFGARIGDPNYDPAFDVNGDGVINVLDLLQVVHTPLCKHGQHDDGDGHGDAHGDKHRHGTDD